MNLLHWQKTKSSNSLPNRYIASCISSQVCIGFLVASLDRSLSQTLFTVWLSCLQSVAWLLIVSGTLKQNNEHVVIVRSIKGIRSPGQHLGAETQMKKVKGSPDSGVSYLPLSLLTCLSLTCLSSCLTLLSTTSHIYMQFLGSYNKGKYLDCPSLRSGQLLPP